MHQGVLNRNHPAPAHILPGLWQFEVFVQFFIGVYDSAEKYCDDPLVVATRYLTSLRGFAFDFITSLPWSYFDLNSYQAILFQSSSSSSSSSF
jgi:hypothetical protein